MDNMSEQEICDFCQSAVKALTEEKKEEVMKCVGQFVYNPKIEEINKKIAIFQKQCKHLQVKPNGRCAYCNAEISLKR